MTKRVFVMEESEREKVLPMTVEELQKYLKNDGYDEMREKIYYREITVRQFETALLNVEKTISIMKDQKTVKVPVTTFKPFEDRLAIFPDDVEVMTKGGLYKPETVAQEKPNKGTIVAMGPGKNGVPMPVSIGMKIYYGKYAGTAIPASDSDPREILIVRYADIFGEV